MQTLPNMSSLIPFSSSVVVLLIISVVLVLLIGALIVIQLRNNARLHDLTYPVYDYTVKEAQHRANQIVTEAKTVARNLIAGAEAEATKSLGERGHESERLMALYEKQLEGLMHTHEVELKNYVAEAEKSFGALTETFKSHVAATDQVVQTELRAFSVETKETRARLETETKRLIAEHLEREVASVRAELKVYRHERMKLIERDIVRIIEQAIAIVLRRELPLKDHADFVYQALEEAKREGTLV